MADLADYSHPAVLRQLLQSLARVICPPKATQLAIIDDVVDHVELSMRSSPKAVRVALLAGLSGYEALAMLYPRHRGKRASRLDDGQAMRYFQAWYHSKLAPQHEFAKGIKSLVGLACYEQPAMMEAIGYAPAEWIEKSVRYRLKTYSEAIAKREIAILASDPLPNVKGPVR